MRQQLRRVSIGYDANGISVNPDPCLVEFDPAVGSIDNDTVQWTSPSPPPATVRLTVFFPGGSPFVAIGPAPANPVVYVASGNHKLQGDYKYNIIFEDAAGKVLAELDPIIQNRPRTP